MRYGYARGEGGFYDDPQRWPKALKRAYKNHIHHNIQMVRDALGEGVVAERQVRDFFSNQGDVICVLDYPPEDQVGAFVNLAFAFSKSYSKANGVAVLDVHSHFPPFHSSLSQLHFHVKSYGYNTRTISTSDT